ncbi:hypothetical protein U9M48_026217, partial [Paspalum notatum var. saurae]
DSGSARLGSFARRVGPSGRLLLPPTSVHAQTARGRPGCFGFLLPSSSAVSRSRSRPRSASTPRTPKQPDPKPRPRARRPPPDWIPDQESRTRAESGPSTLATFAAVYALFGPTFPGIYDKERGIYTLFYPYTNLFTNGEVADLPLEFPDGTTPVTCRVSIYDSSTDSKVGVGSLMDKAAVPALPAGSLYMEEVHAKLGKELWFTIGGQHIPFGASPQDVWADLGLPCGIHQKQVDQMVIHSVSDPRPRTTRCGDYFYNYFSRGIDILFDGQTHRIKKFVLHTNFPGHSDFNSYKKCNFVIDDAEDEGTYQPGSISKNCITPRTKWEQVKEILGDCGRAAIQTQGSMNNPFGSTFVYGYQNIAFEVAVNQLSTNIISLFISDMTFFYHECATFVAAPKSGCIG